MEWTIKDYELQQITLDAIEESLEHFKLTDPDAAAWYKLGVNDGILLLRNRIERFLTDRECREDE